MRPPYRGRDSVQGSVPALDDVSLRPAGVIRETTTSSNCHCTELRMLPLKPFVAQKRRRRLKLLRSGNKLNDLCTDNIRNASFAGILCRRERCRRWRCDPAGSWQCPARRRPQPRTDGDRTGPVEANMNLFRQFRHSLVYGQPVGGAWCAGKRQLCSDWHNQKPPHRIA